MAGIDIQIDTQGLQDLIRQLDEAAGALEQELQDALAEKSIEYELDLRGSGPGGGLTPFDTGRLLTSGNVTIDGLGLEFVNLAPYAEWAHFSGAPTGGYADDSAQAFAVRFGQELPIEWEDIITRALQGTP